MRLSVQCFTLRNEFENDVDGTLGELARMGFRYVETAGFYGLSAEQYATKLAKHGISASGMHVGLGDLESNLDGVVSDAKVLQCPYLILPWISETDYAQGWDTVAFRIRPIADAVEEAGLRFAYHNHAFEFARQPDGRTGFDTLFFSSGKNVFAETDVWWAHCGGEDPADLIRRHSVRSKLVHLKDGTSCESDIHAPAGTGILNWDSILAACDEVGVEFGVVELDNSPGSALEAVRESCQFFRFKGITD